MSTPAALALTLAAAGGCLLWSWWCRGWPTIVSRVAPYVRAARIERGEAQALPSLTGQLGCVARGILAACGSSSTTVRRRLRLAGLEVGLHRFRLEQAAWAAIATAIGVVWAGLALATGTVGVALALAAVLACALAGALARDWYLTRQARARQEQLARCAPDVVELLALAVGAGEAIGDALARVSEAAGGAVGDELALLVRRTRTGTPLARALRDLADANDCGCLRRLADATVSALERGTPLAAVLREQARDERDLAQRDLMEAAGKKEIAMLVPVVFIILPLTVIFALYPGLLALRFGV